MKKLTKLQKEFLDENTSEKGYVCYPLDIFKSKEYKKWKQRKRKNESKENSEEKIHNISDEELLKF